MRLAALQPAQVQELEGPCIRVLMEPPLVLQGIESDHFIDWFDVEIFVQICIWCTSIGVGNYAVELILVPLYD